MKFWGCAPVFCQPFCLFFSCTPLFLVQWFYFASLSQQSHKLDSRSIQLKSFLLKTFLHNYRQLSIQIPSQLQPFSPINMDILVSHCLGHQVMLDNRSKLLKSFLLKQLLMPLRRLEQPKRSTETLKIAQNNHQRHNNSLLLQSSAISNQCIEFTKGLFAFLMATAHQTLFLHVTSEIYVQSCIPIIQSFNCLNFSHPLLGETQRTIRPDQRPEPCEDQAKDTQSAFMSLSSNKCMQIVNGTHQSNNCPHCQCYLGHWFYHNFPTDPIK